jgi:release factor glutamine methyltransferase
MHPVAYFAMSRAPANPPTNQPWTVLRLINWTREYFERQGMDQPRLSAEVLLAHVLECPRLALYTQFERVPSEPKLAAYRELVKRAAAHEPIAYLVGHREFYSLDFIVTPDVLVPRPETELLAERAIDFLRERENPHYWDACTGCGAVPVAVGKHTPAARILASDISTKALAIARRNLERHGLLDRTTLTVASLLELPPELKGLGPFDAITANPPYVSDAQMAELPETVKYDPPLALRAGPEGLDFIRPILEQAPRRLAAGGLLAVEIGFGQAEAVWAIVNQVGQYERAQFARDAANIERILVAYRKA